ncbi:GNAT family N-acetyltransferase [Actinophytocola sp.]|uniref:GNAT family N-acetyltransferase n=1 Tax=Actinophytocola sp. TaxID=1872138 RepID=UPI002D7FBA94|nr:GNAT family N-acetyltransferase [Actinophytocola sp.]HET9142736.1 GNAT family N-acetyltransferase [Actinophytocola sp.]
MTLCTIRPIEPGDKPTVEPLLVESWGAVQIYAVALGGLVDASALPGWIAERDGAVAGLITYLHTGDTIDLVTINSFAPGAGSALLATLTGAAGGLGARRIRVTTTNDNTRALRFYQRNGFRLTALRPDAVARARRHKPQIPEIGADGIPIRDELDLELALSPEP